MFGITPSLILRTAFSFFLLLALTRFLGRKAVAQMTFFDFTMAVTAGTVTASIALSSGYTPVTASAVLIVMALLTVSVDWGHIKSPHFSKVVNSEPVVLINRGKIADANLARLRVSVPDLMMLLREKKVFNPSDVEFAVLETNGQLSVLPKSEKLPVTRQDLNIISNATGLTHDLIIDGQVLYENLRAAGQDEAWLISRIAPLAPRDIFYAGLDDTGALYVSPRQKGPEREGRYGIE